MFTWLSVLYLQPSLPVFSTTKVKLEMLKSLPWTSLLSDAYVTPICQECLLSIFCLWCSRSWAAKWERLSVHPTISWWLFFKALLWTEGLHSLFSSVMTMDTSPLPPSWVTGAQSCSLLACHLCCENSPLVPNEAPSCRPPTDRLCYQVPISKYLSMGCISHTELRLLCQPCLSYWQVLWSPFTTWRLNHP